MLLSILLTSAVWAHADGLLIGIDPIVLESGPRGVESTFGMLWADDGSTYRWLCHEAVTTDDAMVVPRYAASEDSVMFAVVPDVIQARDARISLYRTEDGCTWEGVETDTPITDAVFDPNDPEHALAITADPGATNHILRSTDAGRGFTSVFDTTGRDFRSVQVSTQGQAWATAIGDDRQSGWVYTSADAVAWTEAPVPVAASGVLEYDVTLAAVSPTDPLTAWVVVGPILDDVLLLTVDGGQHFEEVFAVEGDILDAAVDASGGVWLAVSGTTFYYAEDGRQFSVVDGLQTGMGVTWGASSTWFATTASFGGTVLERVPGPGAPAEVMLHLADLQQQDCPVGSHGAAFCDPLWPTVEARLPSAAPADTGEPTPAAEVPPRGDTEEKGTAETGGCGGRAGGFLLFGIASVFTTRRGRDTPRSDD